MWPDPLAGRPDEAADWLAELSAEELRAIFEDGADPEIKEPCPDCLLDVLEPGAVLAGFAADAFDGGLNKLSDDDLVGLLGASRRLSSWQAAVELFVVGELDGKRRREAARPGSSQASEHVSDELAMALVLTARSADALLGLSRDLARIPMVLAALLAGRIDRARAAVFAAELSGLGDVAAAAFCGIAGSMTTGQLRPPCGRWCSPWTPRLCGAGPSEREPRHGWKRGGRARVTRRWQAESCRRQTWSLRTGG